MTEDLIPTNDNITTNKTVCQMIKITEAGEYDSLHDWAPSYDFSAKANVLQNLMAKWESTTQEGRISILNFIQKLNKDWIDDGSALTNILVQYRQLPEVVNLVEKELLKSGKFCYFLIRSMKVQGVRQENWIQKIQENIFHKKFIDSKKWIKKTDFYNEILNNIKSL
jgi:hypothetical protein